MVRRLFLTYVTLLSIILLTLPEDAEAAKRKRGRGGRGRRAAAIKRNNNLGFQFGLNAIPNSLLLSDLNGLGANALLNQNGLIPIGNGFFANPRIPSIAFDPSRRQALELQPGALNQIQNNGVGSVPFAGIVRQELTVDANGLVEGGKTTPVLQREDVANFNRNRF